MTANAAAGLLLEPGGRPGTENPTHLEQPVNHTDRIRPPWTPEQVDTLNAFQQYGGMHPFTCGNDEHGVSVVLMAHRDGWHCSDPACGYRQDWAHAFMADREAWPRFPFGERHGPTPQEVPAAASAVVSPPTNRAALAERLWQVAEHNIIAEWICCDPINPKHHLCVQGDATLRMVRALLVDDPDAAKPAAPLLDAVLAVLGEQTDRAAEFDEMENARRSFPNGVKPALCKALAAADRRNIGRIPGEDRERYAKQADAVLRLMGWRESQLTGQYQDTLKALRAAEAELRRLAVEAHDTGTQQQAPKSFVLWLDASDGSVPTHDGIQWPDGTTTIHHRHFGITTTHHDPEAARRAAHGEQGRIVWPCTKEA